MTTNYFTGKMPLNNTLASFINVHTQAQKEPDLFGVEVEVEGNGKLTPIDPVWSVKEDGSLRALKPGDYAKEFVFSRPLNYDDTLKAVKLLMEYLTSNGRSVYDSERASIHVHINCAMETFRTVYNFITLAVILDEAFVGLNAHHRVGNNFCLRAKDAAGQMLYLIQSIQAGMNFSNISPEMRYSSINFASLLKFGTIEFRSMETHTDYKRIRNWIRMIRELKASAKEFKSPIDIISQFSQLGGNLFIKKVLPETFHFIPYNGRSEKLMNGMRIAQDLAYCSAWNEAEEGELKGTRRSRTVSKAVDEYGHIPLAEQPDIENDPGFAAFIQKKNLAKLKAQQAIYAANAGAGLQAFYHADAVAGGWLANAAAPGPDHQPVQPAPPLWNVMPPLPAAAYALDQPDVDDDHEDDDFDNYFMDEEDDDN